MVWKCVVLGKGWRGGGGGGGGAGGGGGGGGGVQVGTLEHIRMKVSFSNIVGVVLTF